MRPEGGCYCGAVRYVAEGEPALRAQCHCRTCQHISGGAPNLFMLMPAEGFAYTKGAPTTYTRPDKSDAVTREFCALCGTHLITRRPGLPAGGSQDRNAGQSCRLCRRTNGDLHGGRTAFSSHCSRRARLRRVAATPIIIITPLLAEREHPSTSYCPLSVKSANARFFILIESRVRRCDRDPRRGRACRASAPPKKTRHPSGILGWIERMESTVFFRRRRHVKCGAASPCGGPRSRE
jgi:hypothetical protein